MKGITSGLDDRTPVPPRRADAIRNAVDADKHVYCEKPLATDLETATAVTRTANQAGVKHGIVQDKLWLPGIVKLRRLLDQGFFGDALSVRIGFGYWEFTGHVQPANRPSQSSP